MVQNVRSAHASSGSRRGRIVTFYSYKGGLGRTTALAGVAAELALRHDRRVLVIDCDLETPELHSVFGQDEGWSRGKSGLLEYIEASKSEFRYEQDHQAIRDDGRGAFLSNFVTPVIFARDDDEAGGCLDLLIAGDLAPGYLQRLQRLDWRWLYAREGGFWIMERLRLQASESYDVVLIDARAGRSDASLVSLLQLPDLAVIVFPPVESSIASTLATVTALAVHRRTERTPTSVLLVPSLLRTAMTPGALDRYMQAMNDRLVEHGTTALECRMDGPTFALPYDARLASGEAGVASGADAGRSELAAAYGRIAAAIAAMPGVGEAEPAAPV